MLKASLVFVFSLIITLASNLSFAWGKYGHLTVCELAYRNLTDHSKEKLNEILQAEAGGITVRPRDDVPKGDYTSYQLGCLEEDAIPRKNPKDHYINVPRDTKEITAYTSCPKEGCILSAIPREIEVLKDDRKSNNDRAFALFALGHWIGDLHQPLHVSYKDDRGGDKITVLLDESYKGLCGETTKLHSFWDTCLLDVGMFEGKRKPIALKKIKGKNIETFERVDPLFYRVVDKLLKNTTLSQETEMVKKEVWEWVNESYQFAIGQDAQYCIMKDEICHYSNEAEKFEEGNNVRTIKLGKEYLSKFDKVAVERIKLAGFRLAHIINTALDPNYTEPIQNSTQKP